MLRDRYTWETPIEILYEDCVPSKEWGENNKKWNEMWEKIDEKHKRRLK